MNESPYYETGGFRIAVGFMMLGSLLVGGAGATGAIWDEESGSPMPFTWNYTNFDGFNDSGIGTENLTVNQTNLGASPGKTRTIRNWEDPLGAGLIYGTKGYLKEFEVSKNTGLSVDYAMDGSGAKVYKGNYYSKVNFFGETYVALNGKANKLTKQVLELKKNEQKILYVGETWNLGEGWTLKANSIDTSTSPRQVWIALSKDGVKLDDKVVINNSVYTYVASSIAGETNVPMFVTYVDSIFAGNTSDFIILKYTWLLSKNVFEINAGNNYGVFRVLSSSSNELKFENDYTVSLVPNSTINLSGNIKFKTIDDINYLKFYPTSKPKSNITDSIPPYPPITSMASWDLQENYVLNLTDIDAKAAPRQARLQLSKNGILVKDIIVAQDEMFEYCPSNCIFNATVDVIFNGAQDMAVRIANATQYSEINGTPIMTDAVHLFRSGDFTGISWLLDEGYDLKMMDIDYISYHRLVWFELLKNGTVLDDAFLSTDERYTYISPFNSTILTALVDLIFKGGANSLVKLTEVYQYSDTSGGVLLDNATHSYISGEITRTDLPLYEGYNLSVIGIDAYGYRRIAWLQLYKNDTMVDDKIIDYGDIYIYKNSSGIILYAQNSAIFSGRPLSAVKFRNVTQYSEIDGSVLINGATYIIALYGTPVPVPIPSVTQPSGYGTFEVRGIPASGAFKWTPQNFAGFYYDINSNTGTEELNILQPDIAATRTIDNGNLTYSTTAQTKMLNVVKYAFGGNIPAAESSGLEGFDNGSYYIMGWQGERYTALNGRVDKLAGLVLEQGTTASEKKTLTLGESWHIGGNWTLTLQSIDVKAYPRQAWLTLGKDGAKIEDIFVAQQNIYTYVEKSFSNETDVPLFMTYLDSVFAGATTDMVQLRYTWALNTSVTEIMYNETYGIFTDVEYSSDKTLKLKNSNTEVSLSRGSTIDLMGPLRFRVADNDSLRFIPVVVHRQAGTVDIRGAVWNETPIEGFGGIGRGGEWNASNFAGFFYDIDNDLGKEELNVLQTNLYNYQRTIYQNNLVYTTSAQPKMLNLVRYAFGGNVSAAAAAGLNMTVPGQAFEGGIYQIIGWQGEKHVAVNGMVNKLSDLILDQGTLSYERKVMFPNETWNVGGGWSLTLDFADARSSPRKAGITLRKNGEIMGSRVLTSGPYGSTTPVYTYVDSNTSVPVFVTYVDSIFAGAFSDMAQFRYTWAVSPEVTTVSMGGRFGVFNVTEVNITAKRIGLRNVNTTISLSQYSGTVDLMGELKFRIAEDAGVLRFYPFKKISTPQDGMPPGSIFSLRNTSYAEDHINWVWLIPSDIDFDHVQVYLDGNFKTNVPGPSRWFTAVDLTPGTEYTISTHTVDTWGNINTTWVNATTRTAPADSNPPIADCGADKLRCENVGAPVQFNGSASYDSDGAITSYLWEFGDGTDGTGAAPKHTYSTYRWNGTAYLPFTVNLTVTDNDGLVNSNSQKVIIWIAGDANGDGVVSILDASVVGLKWNTSDLCADLNNDGKVNIIDASIIGFNWGKKA